MRMRFVLTAMVLLGSGCGLDPAELALAPSPALDAQATSPAMEAAKRAIRKAVERKAPDLDVRLFWLRVTPNEDQEFDFKGNGVITDHEEQTRFQVWGYYNPKIDKVDFELTKEPSPRPLK